MRKLERQLLTIALVMALSPVFALAQAAGPIETDPAFRPDSSAPAIDDRGDVRRDMEDFLAGKHWNEGENTKANGQKFYVILGTGIIQASRSSSSYTDSRRRAFDKAMTESKGELAVYLGVDISTSLQQIYEEGQFPPPPEEPKGQFETLVDKGIRLLHAKLDKELKKEGVEPEEAEEAVQDFLNKEEFIKGINSVANSFVVGIQAYKTFESSPDGSKGKIGVIAIWSENLNRIASSISTGRMPEMGKSKTRISDQIPTDSNKLLCTFGVQQTRDENGNYVLLAFGQAGASGKSAMAEKGAMKKAREHAFAYIRSFAGESVLRTSVLLDAETTTELPDNSEVYEDTSAYREAIETQAGMLNIKGFTTVRTWQATHPLSGKTVYGSVQSWSPSSAERAGKMGQEMTEGVGKGPQKQDPGDQSGVHKGDGMAGDEDDF